MFGLDFASHGSTRAAAAPLAQHGNPKTWSCSFPSINLPAFSDLTQEFCWYDPLNGLNDMLKRFKKRVKNSKKLHKAHTDMSPKLGARCQTWHALVDSVHTNTHAGIGTQVIDDLVRTHLSKHSQMLLLRPQGRWAAKQYPDINEITWTYEWFCLKTFFALDGFGNTRPLGYKLRELIFSDGMPFHFHGWSTEVSVAVQHQLGLDGS